MLRRATILLALFLPASAVAQSPAPPRPQSTGDRVTERVGAQLGALVIENAGLRVQIEDLQAQIELLRKREMERRSTPLSKDGSQESP